MKKTYSTVFTRWWKGVAYHIHFPDAELILENDILGCLYAVVEGRADAMVTTFSPTKYLMDQQSLFGLRVAAISRDPEFYATLQMSLPHMAETVKLFQRSSKIWADLVKNKDRQEFVKRMSALRSRFEKVNPDFGKAYENMYKIAGRL